MRYGYFDNASREYVIDRVDVPASWTNYIGLKDFYGVFNHTAAGYVLYKSPEYHRITRFRPNGPVDGPGHYVYLRDNDTGDFWSVSWQPVGKPKEHYSCRHGLSFSAMRWAARPETPVSTSSKIRVSTASFSARTFFIESIILASSPPEATLLRGFRSSPALADR